MKGIKNLNNFKYLLCPILKALPPPDVPRSWNTASQTRLKIETWVNGMFPNSKSKEWHQHKYRPTSMPFPLRKSNLFNIKKCLLLFNMCMHGRRNFANCQVLSHTLHYLQNEQHLPQVLQTVNMDKSMDSRKCLLTSSH